MIYDRTIHQYRDRKTGITVFLPTDKIIKTEDMEKSIEIIAPEGYEVDKERSSFEKIVFRTLPDKGLPKTWEGLKAISGYWIEDGEEVATAGISVRIDCAPQGTFPTREEAEASIALAQLCQLRDRYNGGWKPSEEDKGYSIYLKMLGGEYACYVLSFERKELRDSFERNFADLIEKAKPLLG